MVFMPMGNDYPFYLFSVFDDIGKIRDNKIDTKHIFLREHEACIHHDDIIGIFKYGGVEADLLNSTEGNYGKGIIQLCQQKLK